MSVTIILEHIPSETADAMSSLAPSPPPHPPFCAVAKHKMKFILEWSANQSYLTCRNITQLPDMAVTNPPVH